MIEIDQLFNALSSVGSEMSQATYRFGDRDNTIASTAKGDVSAELSLADGMCSGCFQREQIACCSDGGLLQYMHQIRWSQAQWQVCASVQKESPDGTTAFLAERTWDAMHPEAALPQIGASAQWLGSLELPLPFGGEQERAHTATAIALPWHPLRRADSLDINALAEIIRSLARSASTDDRLAAVIASLCACMSGMQTLKATISSSGRRMLPVSIGMTATPSRRPEPLTLFVEVAAHPLEKDRVNWIIEFNVDHAAYRCSARPESIETYGSYPLQGFYERTTADSVEALCLLATAPTVFQDPLADLDEVMARLASSPYGYRAGSKETA
jgi:hypothetical protein